MTKINWNKELVNRINAELAKGKNFPQIAKILKHETGIKYNKDDVRLGYQRHTDWIEDSETVKPLAKQALSAAFKNVAKAMNGINESKAITQPVEFKKLADGSYSSARTLNITDDELKDESKLLKYHGYDPEKWEIKTSSNSRNVRETKQGEKHSYNSRITVKPKQSLTLDDFKKELSKTYVTPMEVYSNTTVSSNNTLVIPLFDLHFGITTKNTIRHNLEKLINKIRVGYDTIIIASGGDVLHSDVIVGNAKTTSGTLLDPADMKRAVQDARSFYDTVFRASLANSNKVKHYAIGGNHDRTTSAMFYMVLEERFPQIEHVTDDYRLAFRVGDTGILLAHGDISMKEIALLFATQYPNVWNNTTNHEVYSGHFHTKNTTDVKGVILRSFGTPKNPDGYEIKNGYLGNRKVVEALEYDEDTVLAEYFL